jgi:hypothetical protein
MNWSTNRRKATYFMNTLMDLRDDLALDSAGMLSIVTDSPLISVIDKDYEYLHMYGDEHALSLIKRDIGY